MKRISIIMIAILVSCTMAMAQGNRKGGERKIDPKERAERMTERMVKEYSLTDTQKSKLYEVNLAVAENMKDRPARQHKSKAHKMDKSKKDANCQCAKDSTQKCTCGKHQKAAKLTPAERTQKQTKMEESRTAYNAKVKEIMTQEQYAKFIKKQADRSERMKQRRVRS